MGSGSIPLPAATALAAKLVAQLAPYCERIEIAGSVRRQKDIVGDIELVVIPKMIERPVVTQQNLFDAPSTQLERVSLLDQQLDRMLVLDHDRPIFKSRLALLAAMGKPALPGGDVQRWGDKAKRFYLWGSEKYGVVNVDLFIANPDNWGTIFTIRTGPHDFSAAFVSQLLYNTIYRQQDGFLTVQATGEIVPVPEESDYFAFAKLLYIQPQNRTVETLKKAKAGWVEPKAADPLPEQRSESLHESIAGYISSYAFEGMSTTDWLRARLLDAAGVAA